MDLTYTQEAHLDVSIRGSSTHTCMRYPQWIFDECGCGPLRGGEQPVHRHQIAELSLRETTALVKVNPTTTCSRSLISLTWSLKPPTLHPLIITAGIEEAHCLCFQPAASGLRFASIGLVFLGMLTFSPPTCNFPEWRKISSSTCDLLSPIHPRENLCPTFSQSPSSRPLSHPMH